jgi:hypothetical protein
MSEFIQYYPAAAPLIGDLYAKSMDWPGADQVAERLENLLPPEIRQKKLAERAEREGEPPPAPPQPPPDPTIELKTQEMALKIKQEEAKLAELGLQVEQEKERLVGIRLDNEIKFKTLRSRPSDEPGVEDVA